MKEQGRQFGRDIGVYTVGQVVCRPTRAEAEDYFRYWTEEVADWGAADYMLSLKGIKRETDPAAYDAMAARSPYENVRAAAYPPVLCTAGLKDDRVPYWEPAKLLANIRRHSSSAAPALLLLNPDSGHQESDQQQSAYQQAALLWAFAQHCTNGK